jgi:hypothetical protein
MSQEDSQESLEHLSNVIAPNERKILKEMSNKNPEVGKYLHVKLYTLRQSSRELPRRMKGHDAELSRMKSLAAPGDKEAAREISLKEKAAKNAYEQFEKVQQELNALELRLLNPKERDALIAETGRSLEEQNRKYLILGLRNLTEGGSIFRPILSRAIDAFLDQHESFRKKAEKLLEKARKNATSKRLSPQELATLLEELSKILKDIPELEVALQKQGIAINEDLVKAFLLHLERKGEKQEEKGKDTKPVAIYPF